VTTPTITPVVTPQQQMALAVRGFSLPEGKVLDGKGTTHVPSIRADGQWVEAIGRDSMVAVQSLVREVARP
jgi:hypothetical protein